MAGLARDYVTTIPSLLAIPPPSRYAPAFWICCVTLANTGVTPRLSSASAIRSCRSSRSRGDAPPPFSTRDSAEPFQETPAAAGFPVAGAASRRATTSTSAPADGFRSTTGLQAVRLGRHEPKLVRRSSRTRIRFLSPAATLPARACVPCSTGSGFLHHRYERCAARTLLDHAPVVGRSW